MPLSPRPSYGPASNVYQGFNTKNEYSEREKNVKRYMAIITPENYQILSRDISDAIFYWKFL